VHADDPKFVQNERILLTELFRSEKVFFGEKNVAETEVLHADEQKREMRARQVPMRRRIGSDSLIVFAFESEGMGVS